jgi:FAS-associated factor 2
MFFFVAFFQSKRQEQSEKRKKLGMEPAATESDVCKLVFRLPNGSRIERRFRNDDTLQLLYEFVETLTEMESIHSFDLYSNFPRQSYADKKHLTMLEANLVPSAMIVVEEYNQD